VKFLVPISSTVVALICGWQSLQLAEVGVTNHIPQIEGDGGAGVVFSVLCLVAGVVILFTRKVASGLFLITGLEGIWASWTYSDSQMTLWALAPLGLAAAAWWLNQRSRRVPNKMRMM
jgi:hypothetical protein